MNELFDDAIVQKNNILNDMQRLYLDSTTNSLFAEQPPLSMQELRLFIVYLSRINKEDVTTRVVRFSLAEYADLLEARLVPAEIDRATSKLLGRVIRRPIKGKKGYDMFQLFSRARIFKENDGRWYVELNIHDEALSTVFNYQNQYFNYYVKNILSLSSPAKIRMYEILKQYEWLGKREIPIDDLKSMLLIDPTAFTDKYGWKNFKREVLDVCQQALQEHTDITYTYERGQVGPHGKWLSVIFRIYPNPINKDGDNIDMQLPGDVNNAAAASEAAEELSAFAAAVMGATNSEFTESECKDIAYHLQQIDPAALAGKSDDYTERIIDTVRELHIRLQREVEQRKRKGDPIKNHCSYMIGMIKKIKEHVDNNNNDQHKYGSISSEDLEELQRIWEII